MKIPNVPMNPIQLLVLSVVLLVWSCQGGSDQEGAAPEATPPVQAEEGVVPEVKVTKAVIKTFTRRLWSNGSLKSKSSLQIKSNIEAQVTDMGIAEGDVVKKGQLLLRFNDADWQLRRKKAQLELEEAIYKKNDLLVLQGGTWGQDSSVNKQTYDNILLESGLKRARLNLEELEFQHKFYEIYAPFDGIIANLNIQVLQEAEPGAALFTLINQSSVEAEFQLMETELPLIRKGQAVNLFPIGFDSVSIPARLTAINPVVDEHGLITARAEVVPKYGLKKMIFPDGMAVKVAVESLIPGQLVIPRSAVVLRSEKPVVFTWNPDTGLARWNYVTISLEEQNEVAISKGLEAGAWVIYEGNLNLDHDAAVKVLNAPNFVSQ